MPRDGGESNKHNDNWTMVFKKQANGAWKWFFSIWSDERLISPTQAD
jgi:ketosteroid isomerase-like protein